LFWSISDGDRNIVGTIMVTSFYVSLDGANLYGNCYFLGMIGGSSDT
jgi:hypothetical protein